MTKEVSKRLSLTQRCNWHKEIEPWAADQVRRNLWRFDPVNDFDDVMQEVRMRFYKLMDKYPDITEPAHFAALFRTTVGRLFIDKARKRLTSIHIDRFVDPMDVLAGKPDYNAGYTQLILQEMPSELKTVLSGLTSGRVRLKLDRHTKKLRQRENFNMRLKRKFSLTLADPVGDLKSYLKNA